MLEVKAYIRVNVVDKVVRTLEGAGISNITVIDVRAIWGNVKEAPRQPRYSLELAERYMNVAKLETLVKDDHAERVVELIRAAAYTGRPGDGVIYTLPVHSAVHVRTRRRGDEILAG